MSIYFQTSQTGAGLNLHMADSIYYYISYDTKGSYIVGKCSSLSSI